MPGSANEVDHDLWHAYQEDGWTVINGATSSCVDTMRYFISLDIGFQCVFLGLLWSCISYPLTQPYWIKNTLPFRKKFKIIFAQETNLAVGIQKIPHTGDKASLDRCG